MNSYELTQSLSGQSGIADMIDEVATSKSDVTLRSAAALAQVCRDVITGEGPTVVGRVHFSRSIDEHDADLCARILVLADRAGHPVSRAEADALLDINAVAADRRDCGRFDDLLAKAIVHHVMSACGRDVPSRDIALAPATELNRWVSAIEISAEVRSWLERRMREISRGGAASCAKELAFVNLFDIAA